MSSHGIVSSEVFLIALRESLEAFLIIMILAGLVAKLGRKDLRRHLLWGAAAAVAFSAILGVIIDRTVRATFESSGSAELYEGVASLLAVLILTYMIIWMYRHTMNLVGELRKKTHDALDSGRAGFIFAISFVAVAREGLETVLFLATVAPSTSVGALWLSLLLGIAVSATLAVFVFTGIVKLNVKKFFAITGMLLIFLAGGLLMTTVHEFSEAGVIPETPTAWNTEFILDQHSTLGSIVKAAVGYREAPTILEALAYFAYVVGVGAWYIQGIRAKGGRPTKSADEGAPSEPPAASPPVTPREPGIRPTS